MAVALRRAQQQRRQQQARIQLEQAARLGQHQEQARRLKPPLFRCRAAFRHYFFSFLLMPPRPAMVTNMSWKRSAILGSKVNQLWISDSGETFSMLAIICCCILSITAVCIGCTSGRPKNCLASSGVQSTSTL